MDGKIDERVAAVLVREERLGVEPDLCSPLALAPILADLHFVAALMDAKQAACRCAAS